VGVAYEYDAQGFPSLQLSRSRPILIDGPRVDEVSGGNGTANTALLAHIFPGPRGIGWSTYSPETERYRGDGTQNARDGTGAGRFGYVGSPHPSAQPFLFADGHVQAIPYGWSPAGATLIALWDYTNTTPVALP
jgi:prepilin-type processing-associated H-X9-DG protein